MPKKQPYNLFEHLSQQSPLRGLPDNGTASNDPDAMQALTTAYITTLYYSALSNLYLQSDLPEDKAEVEDLPRFKIAFERSYTDFHAAAEWLTQNGGDFIATSPAKPFYDEVTAMPEGTVIDLAAAYAPNPV